MKSKISIIGGSGFVGTNLCHLLNRKNWDFEILDLNISKQFPNKHKFADVRSLTSLCNTITGDIVINLAAVHVDNINDNSEYQKTNIDGAKNVAKVCTEIGIQKIIFTSTVAVYGFADSEIDENGKINPFNEYGRTKFEAEECLRKWQKEGNNKLMIIRPTVIFGEGNRGNVYNLFNQIASKKFLMVGKGRNKKSMAYVGNIVAFLEECILSNKNYGLYNYADFPDLTMNELVRQIRYKLMGKDDVGIRLPYCLGLLLGHCVDFIAKMSGKKFPVSAIRVKKFVSSTNFKSNSVFLNDFGAPYTLTEGINRTLDSEFINPNPQREIFYTE